MRESDCAALAIQYSALSRARFRARACRKSRARILRIIPHHSITMTFNFPDAETIARVWRERLDWHVYEHTKETVTALLGSHTNWESYSEVPAFLWHKYSEYVCQFSSEERIASLTPELKMINLNAMKSALDALALKEKVCHCMAPKSLPLPLYEMVSFGKGHRLCRCTLCQGWENLAAVRAYAARDISKPLKIETFTLYCV